MPINYAAENALGTLGAVCWTIQLVPQIWKSWRQKNTDGLSPYLVLLWAFSGVFLGVYSIVQGLNIPLIVQPHIFATLSLVSWSQCQFYSQQWSVRKLLVICISILALSGGFDAGMVFAIRPSYKKGNMVGARVFGILTSVFLAAGLLPQYYEIYKFREVIGISIPFMLIDCLGGVFSLLSLLFRPEFDILGGVAYGLVVVLDGVVLIAAMVLNPLARRRRHRLESTVHTPEEGGPQTMEVGNQRIA